MPALGRELQFLCGQTQNEALSASDRALGVGQLPLPICISRANRKLLLIACFDLKNLQSFGLDSALVLRER